jgi:gamma-D-glutamyl-L-lysine dipeptidyl-peptidase
MLVSLPWGARVVRLDDGTVRLPDGTMARVEGKLVADSEREEWFPLRGESVVSTAEQWHGAPYMWGGVTRAGVDCSGLVQAVYRTHGVQLPRDSDQQARVGAPTEPGPDFEELEAGDLLFFAEEEGRVSHVAISRGGPRIIHASLANGGVAINDLTGDTGFEEELRRIFVCARRIANRI